MEENNNIFLAGGDALVYLAGSMRKNIPQHLFGPSIQQVRILGPIFQPTPPCKHMYAFRATITAVPKNSFKHNCTYILDNMPQMLQVNKNSTIKYNVIRVKLN